MKITNKIVTFIDIITAYPIFWLSCLMPRDKHRWVFIGWHHGVNGEIFADNTKYFFLHLCQHQKAIRPIWLAKDRKLAKTLQDNGYESYYEYSLMGVWQALRAGFTVIDAYLQRQNFRFVGRSKIIQLLHGKGMKAKGYSKPQIKANDYIFHTSPFTTSILPEVFKRGSKNHITGYSRDDIFWQQLPGSNISTSSDIATKLKSVRQTDSQATCFWYAPTFRRGEKTFPIQKVLEPERLNQWLLQNNGYLFINLHPKYRGQTKTADYSRIFFFDESDTYPLMSNFDCLITDYSSIFTDYLLLDRPIIFYPYDLDTYKEKEGLSVDYTTLPGPKVFKIDELLAAMAAVTKGVDEYVAARKTTRDLYHAYQDGRASERIIKTINQEEKLGLDL